MMLRIVAVVAWCALMLLAVRCDGNHRESKQAEPREEAVLEDCNVTVAGHEELLLKGYFGFLNSNSDHVVIVLIPQRFGLAVVRMDATFGDIAITNPEGERFVLGGPKAMILRCSNYEKLKTALNDNRSYGARVDDDEYVAISLRVLVWKRRSTLRENNRAIGVPKKE